MATWFLARLLLRALLYYLSQNTAYWLNDLGIDVNLVVSYLVAVPLHDT